MRKFVSFGLCGVLIVGFILLTQAQNGRTKCNWGANFSTIQLLRERLNQVINQATQLGFPAQAAMQISMMPQIQTV